MRRDRYWERSLLDGSGQVSLESSGLGTYDVTWASRAEEPNGRTSPEELLGAAHSACYSMALSNALARGGNPPDRLETTAEVTFQPGEGITGVHLTVVGHVPGLSADAFQSAADDVKVSCPVSKLSRARPSHSTQRSPAEAHQGPRSVQRVRRHRYFDAEDPPSRTCS